jgi:hypothetical protein
MSLPDASVSGGGDGKEEDNMDTQTSNRLHASNKLPINYSAV